jgi:hypothetical protein
MATGRVPTTANSPLTAKGDLFGYSTAPARLAVGNDGEQIVADSSTSTGLRYQQQNIKNYAYNSNFDIWQRGTSFASVTGYFADRWANVGSFNAVTASRQTSGAAVGSYYYLRHTATGAGAYWNNVQSFETQDCEELWGKTVTLSMKVRRNATANNGGLILTLDKSATVDAGSGASWSAIGTTNVALASIPTGTTSADWLTVSLTVTVPSDGTANSLRINIAYNGGTASGSVYDFSQVMLQVGSVVTAYQRQNVTLQGELAACQRYYSKSYNQSAAPGSATFEGFQYSGVNAVGTTTGYLGAEVFWPVRMRIAPTLTTYDSTYTSGRVSRVTPAVNDQNGLTPTAAFNSESKCLVQSASGNAHSGIGFQWTASAEL